MIILGIYYKIGENGDWVDYSGKVSFFDYNILLSELQNSEQSVNIYAKLVNSKNQNEIITCKEYIIDSSNVSEEITSDSLIKLLENYNSGSGVVTAKVQDETYNLRIYEIKDSMELMLNSSLGIVEDVSNKMVVLKVDGDLTIDEDVVLTSVYSDERGTNGLFIYSMGTFINKGTITMNSRGSGATGQNIYLWKNNDSSYEYVPRNGYVETDSEKLNRTTGRGGRGYKHRIWILLAYC